MLPSASSTHRFVSALAVVGLALVVVPLIDVLPRVWPVAPGEVSWRFGAFGVLVNYLLTPMLGAALLLWMAIAFERRRSARVIGVLLLAGALVLLVWSVLFTLDYLQIRSTVQPASQGAFDVAAWKALAYGAIYTVVAAMLGLGGRTAGRALAVGPARRGSALGLVVGQGGSD